ncbi:MAG: hypothetical protein EP344_11605 [Bacteroidetes bacterium]|nr:MAG: hypothetical protein EP344_11605 [Bacteroidota bacterium]
MLRWLPLLCCLCSVALTAQTDTASLLLKPERLREDDIHQLDKGTPKRKAVSATRNLENIDQLPFTVWVVTAADIERNGFVTLGDVLKVAPGIRVSQPGNVLEGETFMVRGLPGNQYMKVLINDVPIKPTAAPGMPIGAQLPIRQAERIEVVYGPASAIYSDGAAAGVINIILKETERPIFTQADLSFGNFGYNSLDLMLGGKLFKDKNIFRFSLYGSNTVREKSDYFYDNKLFTTRNYLPLDFGPDLYLQNPNYRPQEFGDTVARNAPIPHESRLLGINLTWRGIQFNYNRLIRSDHSSLGLSPLAVSYGNPSNQINEQIETASFRIQKLRAKRTATNTLSFIRYQVRNSSTFTPIFDRLSTALYYAKTPYIQTPAQEKTVLENIYARFDSDERYFVANGFDVRFESRINAKLRQNFLLDAGIQANLGGGVPPMGYFGAPVEVGPFAETEGGPPPRPFSPEADGYIDLNTFAQLQYRTEKFSAIAGAAINVNLDAQVVPVPRLALLYRPDSTWLFRASYAEGFQRPSVYSRVTSYQIDVQDTLLVNALFHDLNRAERTRLAEFGIRRYSGRFTTDIAVFYQEAHNLARNGYLREVDGHWRYGFEQAPGLALAAWGVQGTVGDDILDFDLSRNRPNSGQITAHVEFYFQYSRGREWFGYGLPSTREIRNYPRWITQFRFSLQAKRWELQFSSNRQNGILSGSVIYRDFYQRDNTITHQEAYRTWDAMFRFYLSKNFLIYSRVTNIFNRHYAGIDATGTQDDLLYNPQPGRMVRFGVNYNMN